MKTINVFFICLVMFTSFVYAEEKVVVKYKQYEQLDLGDLEIQGNVVAPGDLSITETNKEMLDIDLYSREEFDFETIDDIKNLR